MKTLFRVMLTGLLYTALTSSLRAQFRYQEIPLLTLADFKAPVPEKAQFPIYSSFRVYYRIDTVFQKNKNKYQVFVKTKIEKRPEESYWDSTRVKKEDKQQLLEHEQGHFYLAHLCGNNIERATPKFNFTANWKEEVRKKFFELLEKEHETSKRYDVETRHGVDKTEQAEWNQRIRKQLE